MRTFSPAWLCSRRLPCPHPRRHIALRMQHAPDIHVGFAIEVEDQVRESGDWPEAQALEIQRRGIAQRATGGVGGKLDKTGMDGGQESFAGLVTGLRAVPVSGIRGVTSRGLPPDRQLHSATRPRNSSRICWKVSSVTSSLGPELKPSSSMPRNVATSRCLRISSRRYSLLEP